MAKEQTITKEMTYILSALKGKPSHGHEIMAQVYSSTGGEIILPISGLIYALRQMEAWEMIEKLPVASGLPRYKLTLLGQEMLSQERQDD